VRETTLLIGVLVLTLTLLSGLPRVLELQTRHHLNAWFTCVFVGDLVGCGFLFCLGLKRLAAIVYILVTLVESALLSNQAVSSRTLVCSPMWCRRSWQWESYVTLQS
jgi:hypothetical protein